MNTTKSFDDLTIGDLFAEADRVGNKYLSQEKIEKYQAQLDAVISSVISSDEIIYDSDISQLFAEADRVGNKYLSQEEIEEYQARLDAVVG